MTQTFDLSTLDWTLRGWHPWFWCNQISMETGIGLHGDVGPVPARVPGSVQQALREARLLPDWTVGLNSRVCEWVEHRHWSYETLLPDSLVQNPGRKVLHLEGLDGNGILFVNGKRVLEFANAFLDHSVDITDYLLTQGNKLCLVFTDQPKSLGQVNYTSRICEWKPRFNYVWDWCPRLVQIGIWDTPTLSVVPHARIDRLSTYTSCRPDKQTGMVHIRASADGPAAQIHVSLEKDGHVLVQHTSGMTANTAIDLPCPKIELWRPWEQGGQTLYTVRVQLLDATANMLDEAVRSVGFREIQWQPCQDAPADALPWICVINGEPLFLQGVNWVPIRPNFADVTESDYRQRIGLYRDLGFNILRVWGGAILEKDVFYRLCDEMGMLIWQEFPLSSSGPDNWPPETPALIADARLIAQSYILRRQHHPSLLHWCGGNELQCDLKTGGPGCGKPVDMSHPMIAALGDEVARLDPTRRFLPSSASGPRFMAKEAEFGNGLHHDVHGPWDQTDTFDQWRQYWDNDDALFRSEVGVPSAGPVDLLRSYAGEQVLPADLTNPLWRHVSVWWIQWQKYLAEGGDATSVEQYVRWSHDRQVAALSYAVQATRRRFPRCGGIILWMGHDCFPCPSNTAIVDYLGRPKPAALALRDLRLHAAVRAIPK